MKQLHRRATALLVFLALLVGQHAALVHGLGHAIEALGGQEPAAPVEQTCDKHFAAAQLSGALDAAPPALPSADAPASRHSSITVSGAPQLTRLAFRSRAPPATPA